MSNLIKSYAATAANAPLQYHEFDAGPLGDEQVEIAVSHCGLCHSDLSMLANDWGTSGYPLVAGHEVVGTVTAVGPHAKRAQVGQTVGLGWYSESCMCCHQCLSGNHNLCAKVESTIVGRHGGFADKVRAHWAWVTPLPAGVAPEKAGPLFCGGITVFNPLLECGVKPTDRVGVVGIGGLGHLALKFLNAWGCEVTAFTSSESKHTEARELGAHHVVNSRDSAQLNAIAGSLDFILSTVNVSLDWQALVNALSPKGQLHTVGAVDKPISLAAFPLIAGQKSLGGSPFGSPATIGTMLDFCARHHVEPTTELFPMSKINDALEHLKSGQARYRVVLENDFANAG